MQTDLGRLIGCVIRKIDVDVATFTELKSNNDDVDTNKTVDGIQLQFEEYTLSIYKPIKISDSDAILNDLLGLKIVAAIETKESAELYFNNGWRLIVNMKDNTFAVPESMILYGPDDFGVVWN